MASVSLVLREQAVGPRQNGGPTVILIRKFLELWKDPSCQRGCHFCGCLKYLKFGGAWSFLVGIRKPSALSM
jgi:hypothetical protein